MHGLIAPVAHPGARLDNIADAVRANTPPTAHAPYTATAAPEWSQHLNVVRRESNDNFAQLASVPAPRLTARFTQPFESSPPAPVPGIQMPPPFDAAVHASIDDYLATHRTQAREAIAGLLEKLKAFTDEKLSSSELASHRRATREVVKDLGGQLSGDRAGIAQLPDNVLLTTTLTDLHRIVAALEDPALPPEGAAQILGALIGRTEGRCGSVNHALQSAATTAEALINGLAGQVNAFKLQVADEVIRSSNDALRSDARYHMACLHVLRREFGLPAVTGDPTITDLPSEDESDKLLGNMGRACTASAFIRHLAEQLNGHLGRRIAELAGKNSGASPGAVALDLDALGELLHILQREVRARFHLDLSQSTLSNALFRYVGRGDEQFFEPHGNDALLRVAVRDALKNAGLIDTRPLRVAKSTQGDLMFDGDVFCIETSFGRRYPAIEDLQKFSPAQFGPTASRLASDVIATCDPSRVHEIPRQWRFLDQATLHGCIKHASAASLQQMLSDGSLPARLQDLSPEERDNTLVALLEKRDVTCRQLVDSRVIDFWKDPSDTLCLLIRRNLGDRAKELVKLGASAYAQHPIVDWRRNPASLALYHGDRALYTALADAGWKHSTGPQYATGSDDLREAAIRGHRFEAVQLMIEQGILSDREPDFAVSMIQARAFDQLKLLDPKMLGTSVLDGGGFWGWGPSPLRFAIEADSLETVLSLCALAANLPNGAKRLQNAFGSPTCRDPQTNAAITPLRLAVVQESLPIAQALVGFGARVRPEDMPALVRGASPEMTLFLLQSASTKRSTR